MTHIGACEAVQTRSWLARRGQPGKDCSPRICTLRSVGKIRGNEHAEDPLTTYVPEHPDPLVIENQRKVPRCFSPLLDEASTPHLGAWDRKGSPPPGSFRLPFAFRRYSVAGQAGGGTR